MINVLFDIFMPAYYRLPMPMANSIPGALMFAAVIPVVGLEAALGATLIAGAISLVAGLAGVMGIVMRLMPMPIVMGMVAGMLLKIGRAQSELQSRPHLVCRLLLEKKKR